VHLFNLLNKDKKYLANLHVIIQDEAMLSILMEINIMENISMVSVKEKVNIYMQMVTNIKVILKIIKNMELVN
jgi:hypothetical protein